MAPDSRCNRYVENEDIYQGLYQQSCCRYYSYFYSSPFDPDSELDNIKKTASIVSLISGLAQFALGVYMLLSSKFKKHPYPLIAVTSLVEGFYYCT